MITRGPVFPFEAHLNEALQTAGACLLTEIDVQVLSVDKRGPYEIRHEIWCAGAQDPPDFRPIEMTAAYTPSSDYIGDLDMARKVCDELRIVPEKSDPTHCVCTIGKSEDGKWYGWSHRAIRGFGVGDRIGPNDADLPQIPIKTDREARQMAIAFARSVS
jgi:hypothetical protein